MVLLMNWLNLLKKTNNMNILDILLDEFNWQGGTIHDAIEHFTTLTLSEQDNIMNKLMASLNKIVDIDNVQELMWIRNRNLIIQYGK